MMIAHMPVGFPLSCEPFKAVQPPVPMPIPVEKPLQVLRESQNFLNEERNRLIGALALVELASKVD